MADKSKVKLTGEVSLDTKKAKKDYDELKSVIEKETPKAKIEFDSGDLDKMLRNISLIADKSKQFSSIFKNFDSKSLNEFVSNLREVHKILDSVTKQDLNKQPALNIVDTRIINTLLSDEKGIPAVINAVKDLGKSFDKDSPIFYSLGELSSSLKEIKNVLDSINSANKYKDLLPTKTIEATLDKTKRFKEMLESTQDEYQKLFNELKANTAGRKTFDVLAEKIDFGEDITSYVNRRYNDIKALVEKMKQFVSYGGSLTEIGVRYESVENLSTVLNHLREFEKISKKDLGIGDFADRKFGRTKNIEIATRKLEALNEQLDRAYERDANTINAKVNFDQEGLTQLVSSLAQPFETLASKLKDVLENTNIGVELKTDDLKASDEKSKQEIITATGLKDEIGKITSAVNEKTKAFAEEKEKVTGYLNSETESAKEFRGELETVSKLIKDTGYKKGSGKKPGSGSSTKEKIAEQKILSAEIKTEAELEKSVLDIELKQAKVDEQNEKSAAAQLLAAEKLNRAKAQTAAAEERATIAALKRQSAEENAVSDNKNKFSRTEAVTSAYKKLLGLQDSSGKVSSYSEAFEKARESFKELLSSLPKDANSSQISKFNSEVNKLLKTLSNPKWESNSLDTGIVANSKDIQDVRSKMEGYISTIKNAKAINGGFNESTKRMSYVVKNADGSISKYELAVDNLTGSIKKCHKGTTEAISSFQNLSNFLSNNATKVLAYVSSFGSFYEILNLVRDGINIVAELDKSYTEMRKVSDETTSSLKEYGKESFNIARQTGTTAKEIQDSTADWMRLGESIKEAKISAKDTSVLFNVSEFDSIDDASSALVSMSQAYKELEKEEIVDTLNNIGNNYAISTNGLAEALKTSASALKTANNDFYEAVALVTAGNAVVQDATQVGSGIRTISLRLVGTEAAKDELKELGEDVSDFVVQTQSKIDEQVRAFTAVPSNAFKGVSLLDKNGNYRSTMEILQDIADIYQEIVETDKQTGGNKLQGLLELIANIPAYAYRNVRYAQA